MQDALGHGQRAGADIDNYQQLALGVHGRPHPVRRALQALQRLVLADRTGFEVAQHRVQLIELQLLDVYVAEEIRGKSPQLLRRFLQPVQHRIGLDLKDPARGPNT